MYNDDTRETYVERRKAENLAQAKRSYEINGSHRNVWIFLFQWAMAEEEYGEHWDKVHKEKNT
jgi:truncated hemoglobin YjbI